MARIVKVDSAEPREETIEEAARIIKAGGLVAFPTETVYGLGADALNQEAVRRIFEVKRRPFGKPLSILIGNKEELSKYVQEVPQAAEILIEKFWPGPLTLIFKSSLLMPNAVKGQNNTIGIRLPDCKIASKIIQAAGVPLACPSANLSGSSPPTKASEVAKDLGERIDLLLDGGETEIGVASTVLDLTTSPRTILREGVLKGEEIEEIIEKVLVSKSILFVCTGNSCRSPMAAGFLKEMLKEQKEIKIDSCGIISSSFAGATPQAIELMKEYGIDISFHKTRSLSKDLIDGADLVLVMEEKHRGRVRELNPEAGKKTFLLKASAGDKEILEIRDPIGLSNEFYREVAGEIKSTLERALPRILAYLRK